MKSKNTFVIGVVSGIAACIFVPLLVIAAGGFNMDATVKPGRLERTLAPWVVEISLEHRAPDATNPFPGATAISDGLEHYHENCVMCHGAPDVKAGELAQGLNPPAPKLQGTGTQEMSDGELFWTVKHGIRMSGMPAFAPTHDDEQIWKLVAFLRHLPHLTDEERAELRAGRESESHEVEAHHEEHEQMDRR